MWDDPQDYDLESIGFSGSDLEPEDLEWLQAIGRKGLANATFAPTTHQASWYGWWKGEPEDRRYKPIWQTPWTEPQIREIWHAPKLLDADTWTTPRLHELKRPPPIPKRPPTTLQHFPGQLWAHIEQAILERNRRKV